MRLTLCLLKQYKKLGQQHARAMQNINKVPFKAILPLTLRDRGKIENFHFVQKIKK